MSKNNKLSITDEQLITIGKMTRGLVHDFNNSLSSIMGYADFLVTDLDQKSEQYKFAVNINKAAMQMQSLLQQITALTKENKDDSQQIDIIKTTEQITDNFFQSLPLIHQGIFETIEINAQCNVAFIKFQTLINNILMNAYQSLGQSSGKITVTITNASPFSDKKDNSEFLIKQMVASSNDDNSEFLYICISDTGCGMDKKTLEYAMESFFSTNSAEDSHGVGLTISCGIVKGMKGDLTIKTKRGVGTSVLIKIPVIIKHNLKTIHKPKNIVLIEDRDILRQSQKIAMTRAGHNVCDFLNVFNAIDHIRENRKNIDLIICDLSIPSLTDDNKSTGEDLLNELKYDNLNIPIIFMSGDSIRLKSLQENNPDKKIEFLSKPFQNEDLLSAINMIG